MFPLTLRHLPLLPVAVAMMTGIALSMLAGGSVWVPAAALCAAALSVALRHNMPAIVCVAIAIGAISASLQMPRALPADYTDEFHRFSARVDEASERDNGYSLVAKIDSVDGRKAPSPVKVSVFILSVEHPVAPGNRITFTGTLDDISISKEPEVPGTFDYNAYLRRNGIEAAVLVSPDRLDGVDASHTDLSSRLRQLMLRHLYSLPLDGDTHAFLAATLLGDDSLLLPDIRSELASAGVAHMLALSGMHIAIIAMILGIGLWLLTYAGWPRMRIMAVIMALWAFAFITGMPTSVVRAVIMATMVLGGKLLQRYNAPLNSLCAAAVVILLLRPLSLFSIGFQLSFAAVAAILLLGEPLNPVSRRHTVAHAVVAYFVSTLAAMLSAGVISLFYFHAFPVYFLIGNLLATLVLPVLLSLAVADMLVSLVVTLPQPMAVLTDMSYNVIYRGAQWISNLPGASVDDVYMPAVAMILCLGALAALVFWAYKCRIVWLVAMAVMAITAVAVTKLARPDYPQSEYYLLDDKMYTSLLIRDADSLYLLTAAPLADRPAALDKAVKRYDDYRGQRGLDHISLAPDTIRGVNIQRRGRWLTVGDELILIADCNVGLAQAPSHINTLIVGRGFTGDIVEMQLTLHPDTLILAPSLDSRRASRYRRELMRE